MTSLRPKRGRIEAESLRQGRAQLASGAEIAFGLKALSFHLCFMKAEGRRSAVMLSAAQTTYSPDSPKIRAEAAR